MDNLLNGGGVGDAAGPLMREGHTSTSLPDLGPPSVTSCDVRNHDRSLVLDPSEYTGLLGQLSIFGMADGGNSRATPFAVGELATGVDRMGQVSTAIAATQSSLDRFWTNDGNFSIGGVGVYGFQFYGDETTVLVPPPHQDESVLEETLLLKEGAFVVIVAVAGDQSTIGFTGVPGLVHDCTGSGPGWNGVEIGHANLKAGTYAITEHSTNHDGGSMYRSDVLGVFAFSNASAGFINQVLPIRVVADLSFGEDAGPFVVDPVNGTVFVPECLSDNLSVVSGVTGSLEGNVPVGGCPSNAIFDTGKGEVFVANFYSNNVSVVSVATDKVVANIPVGMMEQYTLYGDEGTLPAANLLYDTARGEVFVLNELSDNVSVISDTTNRVVATIAVGSSPSDIVYDPGNAELYVTNPGSNNVSVISDATNQVVATIPVPCYPAEDVYAGPRGEIFVMTQCGLVSANGQVIVLSDATNTVIRHIEVTGYQYSIVYDPDTHQVLVTDIGYGELTVISVISNNVVGMVTEPGAFSGMEMLAFDTGKDEFFATNTFEGAYAVTVVSGLSDKVLAMVPTGYAQFYIQFDSVTGQVFVNNGGWMVSMISDRAPPL